MQCMNAVQLVAHLTMSIYPSGNFFIKSKYLLAFIHLFTWTSLQPCAIPNARRWIKFADLFYLQMCNIDMFVNGKLTIMTSLNAISCYDFMFWKDWWVDGDLNWLSAAGVHVELWKSPLPVFQGCLLPPSLYKLSY